ncbi:MAG: phosphate ABC transporter substrate-binding protein [Gammaproteobacteria bacterium]|nr:MAG: phosphate ABC transporter substrate-binding protein [Gammaproteobacteria bacterium]
MRTLTLHYLRLLTITSIAIFNFTFTGYALADIAIIVHRDSPLANATPEEISKIFLAKTKTFPNGQKIKLLDLEEGDETRDKFYKAVANKTPSQVKAYWSRLIFTGKGQPPQVLIDSEEIIEAIEEDPNGIGYVDPEAITDSVKVILTIQ